MQNKKLKHLELGASMYVPATREINNLIDIANKNKSNINLRSVIFCTEDAVAENDVEKSIENLQEMLNNTKKINGFLKFIRVRNESVFEKILKLDNIEKIDGFVIPKFTKENYLIYKEKIKKNYNLDKFKENFYIMPTLETKCVFNNNEMLSFAQKLSNDDLYKDNILCLRIGGNDLLNIIGLRRSKTRTIYESPLGNTISNLVTIFKPYGFNLSAPVCENIDNKELLSNEVPLDLEYGLFGKTAIHPDQIKIIENFYKPTESEVKMANMILDNNTPVVFSMNGVMCEKTVHTNWAYEILYREKVYGIWGE